MFFSMYSVGQHNLNKIATGGFTDVGPHYHAAGGGDPLGDPVAYYERVAEAAAEGLGLIAHVTMHPDVINDTSGYVRDNSMAAIPEAELRQHVRDVMDFTLNDPLANATVSAWYTLPEELRSWRTTEMNYLNIVADEVKNYDPLGRPVSMYNPNHRTDDQLETIVNQGLDTTMMGVYVTPEPFDTRGARVALGVDRIVTAAGNTSSKPTPVYQLSEDYDATDILNLRNALGPPVPAPSEAIKHVIRHDVYQGLLRGAEGIQIWSGWDGRPGLTTFTYQLDGYISVSDDMNGGLGLADVFLQGEQRTDFRVDVFSGPATVSYSGSLGNYTIDTVTTADIAYGDSRYLFLVNSSNSDISISVTGLPPGVPQINDLFSNASGLSINNITGNMLLDMKPLAVIALEIESLWNADANGDGDVDIADLLAWQRGYGASGATTIAGGDFNYDGVVDGSDLDAWKSQFGSLMGAAVAVPEPASWLLLLTVAGLTLSLRTEHSRHDV